MYALDLRNHGNARSHKWSESMSYTEMAEDVIEWMDWKHIEKAIIVGHSMGGKVAMSLATSSSGSRCDGLVVMDIAPVSYRGGDGTGWDTIDSIINACSSMPLGSIDSKKAADSYLKELKGIADPNLRSFVLTNLEKSPSGMRWRINIDAIKTQLNVISKFDSEGNTYDGDTFFIAGGNSRYIRVNHMDEISARFPTHMVSTIRGVGHWLHAEAPVDTLSLIAKYIER